jgi:hypothetical protein
MKNELKTTKGPSKFQKRENMSSDTVNKLIAIKDIEKTKDCKITII